MKVRLLLSASRRLRNERLRGSGLAVLAIALAMMVLPARAAVIYSGFRDLTIPTSFDGIYLDLDAGTTSTAEFTGWDINPFFGGSTVATSPAFLPARTATGNANPILRLLVGATLDATRFFSPGYGGSQTHLGTQFTAGQEGYLGFKFTTNAAAGPYYGWMRVFFTGNTTGALIKDWAYENGGGAIVTARVAQSAPVSSAQVVTLSPATGESFTLGSALTNTSGNINSLVKTGAGTASLAGPTTYTGSTTVSGGTLIVNTAIGTGTSAVSVVNSGSTLRFGSVSQTLASLSIGAGTNVKFSSGAASLNDAGGGKTQGFGGDASTSAAVPEPAALGLLMLGALASLGGRRMRMTGSPPSSAWRER